MTAFQRLFPLFVITLASMGCSPVATPSFNTKEPNSGSQSEATEQNKQGYQALAKFLSDDWSLERQQRTADPDLAQIIATAQGAMLDLDRLRIDDPELQLIRDEARAATKDAIVALRTLQRLPRPPGSGELFLSGFVCGLAGRLDLAVEAGSEAQRRVDAILAEVRALHHAYERACSAKLLLKRIALRYSGSAKLPDVGVDIDEAFVLNSEDTITFTNTSGRTLRNALVTVQLRGSNGGTKENVHFVTEWSVGQTIHATYSNGVEAGNVVLGCQTVVQIQSARIRVVADEGQTSEFTYQYASSEADKDVNREFDILRPNVCAAIRNGAIDGLVFIVTNDTGRRLPSVSIHTPAGNYSCGTLTPGHSVEVGWMQVSRNLKWGERVTVFVAGRRLCSYTL